MFSFDFDVGIVRPFQVSGFKFHVQAGNLNWAFCEWLSLYLKPETWNLKPTSFFVICL